MLKRSIISLVVFLLLTSSIEILFRYLLSQKYGVKEHEISAVITAGKMIRNSDRKFEGLSDGREKDGELVNFINHETDITSHIPIFLKRGIGLGNSPFDSLITKKNRTIIRDKQGDLISLGGTKKYIRLLKSKLYNPWDPIIFNSYNEVEEDSELQEFVGKYALKPIVQSTDENGYRLTLPRVNAEKIILIIGDSVAFGASIADDETIASQLQREFSQVRFINDSIGQGTARDNRKRLTSQLQKHEDSIVGVIYVHTENDYTDMDTPRSIIEPLAALLSKSDIPYQAFIHQVYIYQAMPDIFRSKFTVPFGKKTKLRGRDEKEQEKFFRLKRETLDTAEKHNIHTIDFYEIVEKYRYEQGTPLAGFSLYVDHCHFSREGVEKVVHELNKTLRPFIDSNIQL